MQPLTGQTRLTRIFTGTPAFPNKAHGVKCLFSSYTSKEEAGYTEPLSKIHYMFRRKGVCSFLGRKKITNEELSNKSLIYKDLRVKKVNIVYYTLGVNRRIKLSKHSKEKLL